MSTPHIQAKNGEIAGTVLMPGDPLRASYIAHTYLSDVHQFNSVRNMLGYTGTYNGTEISVMGSGMGMPSIGIYSYELYSKYDVENIIRIGSAGSYSAKLDVLDLVLADSAWSESTFAKAQAGILDDILFPDKKLNDVISATADKLGKKIICCRVHSSDVFYHEDNVDNYSDILKKHGCLCVDMESFALFHNANILGKKAACMLTISDSFSNRKELTSKERETSLNDMMVVALESAIELETYKI